MVSVIRTDSSHPAFIQLVKDLDDELRTVDFDYDSFHIQFNSIDVIPYVVIAYDDKIPVGCGGIKVFENDAMEIKRMYTVPAYRGRGVAVIILTELEKWTTDLGMKKCVLETGSMLTAAIRTYEKNGYVRIPNYGQYIDAETSLCFEKLLPHS